MYISPELSKQRIAQGNCYKCNADLKTHKRCYICNSYLICDQDESYCQDCKDTGIIRKLQRKRDNVLGGSKRKGFRKFDKKNK